jgi:glycosyltransferase involved in cell wall biosynthesis
LHGSSHDLSFVGNWLSLRAAALAGARTIWHIHEDLGVVLFPGKSAVTRGTFANLTSRVDLLAVMTSKDRTIASTMIDAGRIVVIPETCNPEMLQVPLERPGGDLRLLYVGWLSRAKGIYDLFEVADISRRLWPGMVFDVLGTARSAEENALLHRIVQERGLEHTVRLRGVKWGRDKYEMFAQAHALFMPTHWDAFPVTVLEAMAAGLPVLGTRVGGLPFMLEEEQGAFLSPVGDVADMAANLALLARNPQLRARMGAANRARFAATYHPNTVGQLAVDVYHRLAIAEGQLGGSGALAW